MFKFSFLSNMKCISQLIEAHFSPHTWNVRERRAVLFQQNQMSSGHLTA